MSEDLIKRSDAVAAIANLHISHDREEIFKAYAKNPHSMTTDFEGTLIDAINAVEALPSADRPQGEWKSKHNGYWTCSECGLSFLFYAKGNFCPNCGARMKGADDEAD